MKISVSLPDEDVALLDEVAREEGLSSRSAALHRAVELLRLRGLEVHYDEAWAEWQAASDADAWDGVAGDGLGDAAR
ncbi:hypothetical protein DUHN55_14670 [Helicobacter pylori]